VLGKARVGGIEESMELFVDGVVLGTFKQPPLIKWKAQLSGEDPDEHILRI
jgi:hypothetical protein